VVNLSESVASFLSAVTAGLEESLAQTGVEQVTVSWTPRDAETPGADLTWWSCGLSVDTDCRLVAGAPAETWEALQPLGSDEERFGVLAQAIQTAAQARFGSEVSSTEAGPTEQPSADWTAAALSISLGGNALPAMELELSPGLVAALGGQEESSEQLARLAAATEPSDVNPVDRLLGVEIPVSVSLGRTHMRMKDLLALTHGSIVELDQELNDQVEIRVSNRMIARGEVVAVDGNYGVRILKMIANGSASRDAIAEGEAAPKGTQ
jgi:flagellar motor switch protein FliN/FliY